MGRTPAGVTTGKVAFIRTAVTTWNDSRACGKEMEELDRGDRVDLSKLQAVARASAAPRLTLDQLDDLLAALGQQVLAVDRGEVGQVEIADQEPPSVLDQHGRENERGDLALAVRHRATERKCNPTR